MVTEDMGEDPLWVQVGAASLGALCIGIWIAIDFSWTLGVRMVGVSLAALIASLAHVLLSESAAKEHEKWSELDRKKNPERDWGWTNIAALDHEGDIVLGRGRVKRVLRQAAMVGDLAEKTGKTLEEWFADLDTLNAEYEQKHNTGMMIRNMKKHLKKNHGFGDYQTETVVKLYLKGRRARKRSLVRQTAMVRGLAKKTGMTLEEWFAGLDYSKLKVKLDQKFQDNEDYIVNSIIERGGLEIIKQLDLKQEYRIFYMKKYLKEYWGLDDYRAKTIVKLYLERHGN